MECSRTTFAAWLRQFRPLPTNCASELVQRENLSLKLLAMATRNKVIAMIVDSVTEIHMRFVYAKVASSGAATPRLAEKRRQFLAALRARDVLSAARLMRIHLESVQRMLEQDPGSMSLHVALAEMQPGMRR